ncbi:MAG: hypothetical protein WBJ21_14660, partial [Burkholderiaceae bacterium]
TLVNAAMAGQTRVRSASWIDGSGQLHENTRINSDMKIRGVRVLSYADDATGPLAVTADEGRAVTQGEEACKDSAQKYRREASLLTALRIVSNATERYDWTMVLSETRARLVAQTGASRQWLLSAPATLPDSNYERMLTGAKSDQAPYQMLLELLPSGALGVEVVRPATSVPRQALEKVKNVARGAIDYLTDEPPRRGPMPFVIRLSVTDRSSQKLLWQDAVPLFFPESAILSTRQPLPPGLITELERVVQQWQSKLDAAFGCRPLQFNLVGEAAGSWTINGGQSAGVAIGDQLLLLNRERLPARILEPDSAQHMALAEVVAVSLSQATLRKLAGPAVILKNGDWVATPF